MARPGAAAFDLQKLPAKQFGFREITAHKRSRRLRFHERSDGWSTVRGADFR